MKILKPGETTFIYFLVDPITGCIKYVGKSDNPVKRFKKHLKERENTYKINWINSLVKNNKKPLLEVVDEVPFNEWSFWEKHWISLVKSWGFNLTNLTEGGDGGNFGGIVNKKISEKLKGIKRSEDTKKKLSEYRKGLKASEETKNKLSQQRLGNKRALGLKHSDDFKKYMSDNFKGDKNPMYGKTHSERVRNKMSGLLLGKYVGDKNHFYGKKHSEESKNKMYKKVIQKDLNGNVIKIWNSFKEASETLNIRQSGISGVCNKINRTYGGYKWEKYGTKNK